MTPVTHPLNDPACLYPTREGTVDDITPSSRSAPVSTTLTPTVAGAGQAAGPRRIGAAVAAAGRSVPARHSGCSGTGRNGK
jgi:hypothetical protein